MNWDAIGAVGEIAGAIAVVATIVYLARQVRDNSKHVMLNTTQSYASLVQEGFTPIYNSPETIRIWHQGNEDPSALDAEELKTYYLFMDRLINNALPLIAHYKEGVIVASEFAHYRNFYSNLVGTPGGIAWKAERRFHFDEMLTELENA